MELYTKNVYKFMPNPGGNLANFSLRMQKVDEKKILGTNIEKYGDNQVTLCPKCCTI